MERPFCGLARLARMLPSDKPSELSLLQHQLPPPLKKKNRRLM
jgi:hypothetical protein